MKTLPLNTLVVVKSGLFAGKVGYVDMINKDGIWIRGGKRELFPYHGAFSVEQLESKSK
ncbi:MAG: hypothetical protein KME46_32335 [Brasilonema angustatum HA4187-MV1]|nr:hypothetical protein [Brasilonema angustatum HA4187-MV1]